MPQAIGEPVVATSVTRRQQFAVFVEVRDVGQCLVAEAVAAQRGRAGLRMQHAIEAFSKGELGIVRECLVAKDEHPILMHALPDGLQQRACLCRLQINRTRFGSEQRMQWAET